MNQKTIRIITACIVGSDGILAISDKLAKIPGLPPAFAQWWPVILVCASLFDRIGHILIDPTPAIPVDSAPAAKAS